MARGKKNRRAEDSSRDIEDDNALSPTRSQPFSPASVVHSPPTSPQLQEVSFDSVDSHNLDIRRISVPVDDAFRYSSYDFEFMPKQDTASQPDDSRGATSPRVPPRTPKLSTGAYDNIENESRNLKSPISVRSIKSDSVSRHISFASKPASGTTLRGDDENLERQEQDDVFETVDLTQAHNARYNKHNGSGSSNSGEIEAPDRIYEFGDEEDDGGVLRHASTMQRRRWGTQRHKKGRPIKRSKSIFRNRSVKKLGTLEQQHLDNEHGSFGMHEDDHSPEEVPQTNRSIYVNMALPEKLLDPETGTPLTQFPRNKVRTTKYTPLSFVPKNLVYQFKNVANAFFLFIAILSAFPIFGVQDAGLAAVPIIVIVTLTAIKDAIEDYRRTLLDLELNNTPTEILSDWHNYNVVEDNVSLWRRFKKANTRLLMRIMGGMKKKNPSNGGKEFNNGLQRATTISSIVTRNSIAMNDLRSSLDNDPFSDRQRDEVLIRGGSSRPKRVPDGSSVLDNTGQAPGKARFKRDYWKNVRVGDFVRIRNNDEIPADIVILATSDDDGACYIETKNLDGETNLKVRQALNCGEGIKHSGECERAKFWIESEGPLPNLYSYNGVAKWVDEVSPSSSGDNVRSEPITINNLLLRGCALRNTDWAIGIVAFTGVDTKIVQNAGVTPTKRSRISTELNGAVIMNFFLLFILCFVSGVVNGIIFGRKNTSIDYFEYGMIGGSPPINGLVTFWASIILYQGLIPISLYISIEIVKTIQAFFIYSDCHMYYEPIDYPCTPKSWNISDDLGQIEYIFSDKTGTLTQNAMEFKKCSINGMAYGKAYTEALAGLRKREGVDVEKEGREMREEISRDRAEMLKLLRSLHNNPQMVEDKVTFVSSQYVKDLTNEKEKEQRLAAQYFMLALALCHSVIVEEDENMAGMLEYKAQSPDEAALVATAKDMGFTFTERTRRGVVVNVQGRSEEFQILNTLEFNSTRKRMSAIIKFDREQAKRYLDMDEEKIILICKGADSVIYSRLCANAQEELRQETALHLEQFANEGLRTLCIAHRFLSAKDYNEWNASHEVASASITNREEKMEEVADSIERELILLGGTAIEDRLQDGVPQSIALLGDAGIKLWVLTGDKVETAINIGFSCNLLDNTMELLVLRVEDNTKRSAEKLITDYLHRYFNLTGSWEEIDDARNDHGRPSARHAVIIDGDTLKLALHDDLKLKFLLLCKQCKSVLCCRVSPAQKAAVVLLVKETLGVMTLSIGDGANDVAMIQAAHVGVGIAGEEGRQAVMSSDYAIGQFRFLTRLLLVHGRWSYRRLAEMIPNFFYKNVVFTVTLFWYGIFSSFDGAYLYEYTYVMFFNLAFTSLPIIFMGVLDQDVSDKISLAVPSLYQRGILRKDWNMAKFYEYMIDGAFQSFVAFFFPYFVYSKGLFESPTGRPLNHRFWMGLASCTISVVSCNIYVILNQLRWDWLSLLIGLISCLLVYFWTGVYSSVTYSGELYKVAAEMFGSLNYWAVILTGIVLCLLPHLSRLSLQKVFYPEEIDIVRERWRLGDFDYLDNESGDEDTTVGNDDKIQYDQHRNSQFISFGGQRLEPEEHTFDNNSAIEGSTADEEGSDKDPFTHPLSYYRRSQEGNDRNDTRKSLDEVRRNLRMEQAPPRESIEGLRASMDLKDLTTAEGLMRVMSRKDS